jgi:hypothetical protein
MLQHRWQTLCSAMQRVLHFAATLQPPGVLLLISQPHHATRNPPLSKKPSASILSRHLFLDNVSLS